MAKLTMILLPISEGQCIYCQTASKRLTEEHVIPVGLGGKKALPNASCEQCRKITHAFETTALRHVLGPGRYWLGIRARKPKNRPKTWPALKQETDGTATKVNIPIEDLPFFICLPTYTINPAIRGSIPNDHEPTLENGFVVISEEPEKMKKSLSAYGADTISTTIDHVAFARMLAKIAIGYCIDVFGYRKFTPMVNPFILGETNGFPNLISSSMKPWRADSPPPLEQRYEHQIMHKISREGTICVRIDLFINLEAPTYYVMAGVLVNDGSGALLFSVN